MFSFIELSGFLFMEILNIFISFVLAVAVHEFGHFTGGRLSGYQLSHIMLFNICFIKQTRGIKVQVRKFRCPGQCVMYSANENQKPYFLILGGCFSNCLIGSGGIVCLLSGSLTRMVIMFPFVFLNLFLGIYNFILNSSHSDGRTLRECLNDSRDICAYNNLMVINRYLDCGRPFESIPARLFKSFSGREDSSISNDMLKLKKLRGV